MDTKDRWERTLRPLSKHPRVPQPDPGFSAGTRPPADQAQHQASAKNVQSGLRVRSVLRKLVAGYRKQLQLPLGRAQPAAQTIDGRRHWGNPRACRSSHTKCGGVRCRWEDSAPWIYRSRGVMLTCPMIDQALCSASSQVLSVPLLLPSTSSRPLALSRGLPARAQSEYPIISFMISLVPP